MVHLPSITAATVLTASAAAQKFNAWPQYNHGGWYNQSDGDVTTSGSPTIPPGGSARFSFLFNRVDPPYAGFYVQSSGDYITDYTVYGIGYGRPATKGRVCGAKGNFTFVPLTGPNDEPPSKRADTLFLDVTAANNSATKATINEIWPVWVGDEIFYPNNTSPCPPDTKRVRRSARMEGSGAQDNIGILLATTRTRGKSASRGGGRQDSLDRNRLKMWDVLCQIASP